MVEMVFSSYERMQVPDLLQNVKPIPVLPESVDGMSSNSPSTHAAIQEEEAMALASVTSEPCLVFDSELLVEKLLLEEECSNCCDDNSADVHNDNTSRQDKLLLTRGFASDNQSRTNLFISNIPHKMEQRELENLFAPYGQILSAAVMRNIHTGKSLGTAFVRYASTEEAMSAIKGMSGKRIGGRAIAVQWAKKQHDYAPVGEARKKISKLFVRNIPWISTPSFSRTCSVCTVRSSLFRFTRIPRRTARKILSATSPLSRSLRMVLPKGLLRPFITPGPFQVVGKCH
ncbi:putative RNA-binding protein [Trypanosoma cruzi]|uniref:Putative RNA-binding protein n=1 Tax=Trypanosoma cruzi TaxID=5693 RepID=A0A2V2VXK0_TRYCR|nr:putative RNA-binding protein [Trypanosoma cruzi]